MVEIKDGSVTVHGLNTKHAPTSVVREKFFVTIPQEAVLFNQASLRFNLDPSEVLSNDTILDVLKKVQLLRHFKIADPEHPDMVPAEADTAGQVLDSKLSNLPALSAGQTQLLALGRALLQAHTITQGGHKPVILLDEATSSLDIETERLMLSIIHEVFTSEGYTVIMVAHRAGAVKAIMREGVDQMIEI
jgi:ATP-binding cassette, subfamily C (CFTR/MRP), member 1